MHNWRDYGGNGRIAAGKLFRSAAPCGVAVPQRHLIETTGFAAIIDLRGISERRQHPAFWPGFPVPIFAVDAETSGLIAAAAGDATEPYDAACARKVMLDLYAEQPYRPGLLPAYRAYFRALASSSGPTLVYCSAGKDRTGLAVALLQNLLGVHGDDVMIEYLRSNDSSTSASAHAVLKEILRVRFNISVTHDGLLTFAAVSADYLQAALNAIRTRSGSVDAYLENTLGVTREVRTAIRKNLLV